MTNKHSSKRTYLAQCRRCGKLRQKMGLYMEAICPAKMHGLCCPCYGEIYRMLVTPHHPKNKGA